MLRNSVEWKKYPVLTELFGKPHILDEMRFYTLASVLKIEKLVVEKAPPNEAAADKWKQLLDAKSLKMVHIKKANCIEGVKISDLVS